MEIRIRRARRTDYAALAALCGWPPVDSSRARSVRLFRKVVSDLAYDLYVAEHGEKPVGLVAVSYVRVLALDGQRAVLEDLLVHPEHRLSGVGRQLMEFVVRRASRRGARVFEARPADEDAERFLGRLGFLPRGRRFACSIGEESPR
jgi:ribosomal protein S18 acetylase RimI-like enzyme